MSIRGFGKGYWSSLEYKNAPDSFEKTENLSDFNNILPEQIEGKKPTFYQLELVMGANVPIRIDDKFIVEPIDCKFVIDVNDKPIHKLEILAKGVRYYVFGKYM